MTKTQATSMTLKAFGRRSSRLVSLALALGLLWANATTAGIVVQDDRHHSHEFKSAPQRIITLLPSLTESVCALNACARLVATDRYSNWPAAVLALPKVGGIDDTPIERIVALKPDVVLAARSSRAVTRLEELHIPVVTLEPQSLEDVFHTLETLSILLDARPAHAELVSQLQKDLDQATALIPATRRNQSVYFEVAEHRYAASQSSYIGQVLARLGLHSSVPGTLGAFPAMSWEWVLTHPPDLLMVDQDELDNIEHRPLSHSLLALQTHAVCAFPKREFEVMARPGPRVGQMALSIAHCVAGLSH